MWYYTLNNQQVGPVDENEIKKLIAAGTITHATMVWTTGMANWQAITQTGLAPLMGAGAPPPPPPIGAYPPMMVLEDPKVRQIKTLFMWFWITLAAGLFLVVLGTIFTEIDDFSMALFGLSLMPVGILAGVVSAVFFFILIYKAWQLVQHEGIRANPDQAVAYCFITPWNFYWFFYAFRGLAKEINLVLEKEKIAAEPMDLTLALWFVISLLAITLLIGAIPFIVLLIIYTKKLVDAMVAITKARL